MPSVGSSVRSVPRVFQSSSWTRCRNEIEGVTLSSTDPLFIRPIRAKAVDLAVAVDLDVDVDLAVDPTAARRLQPTGYASTEEQRA